MGKGEEGLFMYAAVMLNKVIFGKGDKLLVKLAKKDAWHYRPIRMLQNCILDPNWCTKMARISHPSFAVRWCSLHVLVL